MKNLVFITEAQAKKLESMGLKPIIVWAIPKTDIDFISSLHNKRAPVRNTLPRAQSRAKAIEFEVLSFSMKGRQQGTKIGECVEATLIGIAPGKIVSRSLFNKYRPWIPQALVDAGFLKITRRAGE